MNGRADDSGAGREAGIGAGAGEHSAALGGKQVEGLDESLRSIAGLDWPGPGTSRRIEEFLMQQKTSVSERKPRKLGVWLGVAAVLASGVVYGGARLYERYVVRLTVNGQEQVHEVEAGPDGTAMIEVPMEGGGTARILVGPENKGPDGTIHAGIEVHAEGATTDQTVTAGVDAAGNATVQKKKEEPKKGEPKKDDSKKEQGKKELTRKDDPKARGSDAVLVSTVSADGGRVYEVHVTVNGREEVHQVKAGPDGTALLEIPTEGGGVARILVGPENVGADGKIHAGIETRSDTPAAPKTDGQK